MTAELVETSRLWGRTVARIDPRWVEPLAGHLIKRTYEEPRWERKRAQVVATERVTLYGLPIVAGRTVAYGRIDPALSRDLFIRRALVEGEWDTRHRFFAENQRAGRGGRGARGARPPARHPRRRPGALRLLRRARSRDSVISGAHFDRWWRDERRVRPDLLTFTRELLINPTAAEDVAGRPDIWRQGETELKLSYRFEPGSAHDGVTVHVPLKTLPQLQNLGFEWLVPALRAELVTALIRSLPKDLRKRLVPVPDVVATVLERMTPRSGPLLQVLGGRDRGPARRPHPARRLGPQPAPELPEDDVQRRGRARQGDRRRPGSRRAARAGAPDAAQGAGGRDPQARADGPDELDVRDDPEGGRAPRHRPDGPRLPVAGRRGRDRRPARAREPGRAGAQHARRHAPAAGADDPVAAALSTSAAASATPPSSC